MSALHPTALVFPDIVLLSDNNILDASVIRFWDTSIWSEVKKIMKERERDRVRYRKREWGRERERVRVRERESDRYRERKEEATINHKELSTEIEADKTEKPDTRLL